MTVLDVPGSLFGHTEDEYIPDAESVYLHREQHHQPQACTLAQCFQLYTKEEQVIMGPHMFHRSCWFVQLSFCVFSLT